MAVTPGDAMSRYHLSIRTLNHWAGVAEDCDRTGGTKLQQRAIMALVPFETLVVDSRPHETELHMHISSTTVLLASVAMSAGAIAQCQPQWQAFGEGMNNLVNSLVVMPNGDMVAGGRFTTAGGVPANSIARWDGSNWSALGSGMTAGGSGGSVPAVFSLAVLTNGDVVAGGDFTKAGGVSADYIARWDGSNWYAMGSVNGGWVFSLAVLPGGDLVAGGIFSIIGGVPANGVARWDGTTWSALGLGITGGGPLPYAGSLAVLPNGGLVTGGDFTIAGGMPAHSIARWNGSSWSPLGAGMGGTGSTAVASVVVLPNGDLLAGGVFTKAGGVPVSNIAHWDGSNWSALGSGISGGSSPLVISLAVLPNGDLVAGGEFTTAGGVSALNIARWGCGPASCYADCDLSGSLDSFDFWCFQNAFSTSQPYADCDGNGSLDFFDFLCFQNAFAAGCP